MNQMSVANRSRGAKRWGVALAAVLVGTMVSSSASQAASRAPSKSKYGGEIVQAIDAVISGFCFSNALPGGPLGASRTIYESLVERAANGKFVPHLASKITMSADAKEWTFALRPGIKYSNGEEFNAANVKLNIDFGRSGFGTLNGAPFATNNTGGYPSTGIGVNSNIMSVDVVDNLAVKVTLERGDTEFLGLMYRAGRYVMRANEQIADSKTCSSNPIGTGPFMKQSFSADELVVVKNPNYWRTDAKGGKLPYLDKITFINIKEASSRAAAVRTGAVDAAFFTTGDATFILDLAKRKSVVTQYKASKTQWGQWMPNVGKAGSPFKFLNCRLAAAHAIDWNAYNKVRLKGLGSFSGSVVGKTSIMFTTAGAPKFSVTKAKAYVKKCNTDLGAAAPFNLTLYADTSSQSQRNVKFVSDMLAKVGIKMNAPNIEESAVLVSKIYRGGGNLFDFAEGTPAEGDAIGYIVPFFVSKAFPADSKNPVAVHPYGKGYNTVIALGGHGDTTMDDKFYAAMAETNKAKSKAAWKAATKYLQENALAIPAVHGGFWMYTNKSSKLRGIGALKNPDGSRPSKMETKGFEWTGVYKG
jgi:peptide/nickel transport system substrate-binding protein